MKYLNEKLTTLILYLIDIIFDNPNLKNGFIPTSPRKIERDGDFIHAPGRFGFVAKDVLKADGNYKDHRPVGEPQDDGDDKMHCVSESICNTIETRMNYYISLGAKATDQQKMTLAIFRHFNLIKKVDGKEKCLISTRYVAAGSGTTIRGNSQKTVVDFIRHYGLVPKDEHPYVRSWNEYYYPANGVSINGNKVPQELLDKGKRLVEYIEFNYEWVHPNDVADTYTFGPLQNIGFAWELPVNGIIPRTDRQSNHAFMGDGKQSAYHQVFDSYDPFDKKVAVNFYKSYGIIVTIKAKQPLTTYNSAYINALKKKGLEYVLLVNKFANFDQGVYRLLTNEIEKANLKVMLDAGVKKLANDGKLTGISVEDFKKIINLA